MDNTIERLDIQASFTGGDAQSGLDKLYATLDKISNITSKVTKATENSSRANITSKVNFASLERVATVTAKALSKCFTATNDYVESLNLFNVAMGDATQKALEYAMTVERVMGINSGDWMNYQGSYNQIFEGYGLDPDQANQMSQQLTQLTYDLSSLWNVDTDTAFQKIQSGMSGQIKGLKVWGYNLSVASLRETALAHGIELSTAKMTESQKAILRYITLMEASSNAHGDLARTILTPANSLRILKSQFEIMQRTVGQVVSVFAVKLIPVVQVMIQWVTALAEKMAQAFGYELPEIDYTGISAGAGYADDLANGLDDSAKKAEKLKRSLLGIDEINKLSDNSDKSTATEYGGGYAPDFGMNLDGYDYDFLGGIEQTTIKLGELESELEKYMNKANEVVSNFDAEGAGSKLSDGTVKALSMINTALETFEFYDLGTKVMDFITGMKWENIGYELSQLASNLVITAIDFVVGFLNGGGDGKQQTLTDCVTNFLGGVVKGIKWGEVATKLINGVAQFFLTPIKDLLGKDSIVSQLSTEMTELINYFSDNGYFTVEGFKKGAQNGFSDIGSWIAEHISTPFLEWFCSLFGIHSPSTIMEGHGENIGAGLKIGVDRSIKKSDYTSIFERIKSAWNDFKSWWSNLSLPQLKFKMPHFTWTTQPASGWVAEVLSAINLPVALPKLNVSWYASGGFPQTGEMFIANEAGPELVGTIGNKTAVANQGQIEAGIATGVADANEEQNRLLREQNSLLTKLLHKESVVQAYVTASDIVSGLNQKNRRDGKTTVPVGV